MPLLIRVNRFNVLTVVFAVALGSRSRVASQRPHIFYQNVPKTTLGVNVAKLIPLEIIDEKKGKRCGRANEETRREPKLNGLIVCGLECLRM